MKRQAENFHVVVGMTRLIKMPSYWFGDVLAVVFHIQKMFAETISQPSSCFADVKLVTDHFDCTSRNVIYCIRCTACNQKIHRFPLRSVSSLIPFLTPFTHNPLIRSDEGLALETSAIVSFTAFHYPHQHTVDTPVYL